MDIGLVIIRLRKLATSLIHPSCWRALAIGVAPSVEHLSVIRSLNVDGIIDVGANRGQFSLACRLTHPKVPIVAFEPNPCEAAFFRQVHGSFAGVKLVESALGDTRGQAILHLSQSADSSSLLPIGKHQTELFRNTGEIGTISVPVQLLDELANYWSGRTRQLLKLDVQGFELNVLRGATAALGSCAYVYVECSEIALYEGQALRIEVESFLSRQGFYILGCYNAQMRSGQLIQADYLFARTNLSS